MEVLNSWSVYIGYLPMAQKTIQFVLLFLGVILASHMVFAGNKAHHPCSMRPSRSQTFKLEIWTRYFVLYNAQSVLLYVFVFMLGALPDNMRWFKGRINQFYTMASIVRVQMSPCWAVQACKSALLESISSIVRLLCWVYQKLTWALTHEIARFWRTSLGFADGGEKEDSRSVKGDPLIRAFDGSLFFFHGEPGKIYNFASLADGFQVITRLKLMCSNCITISHTNALCPSVSKDFVNKALRSYVCLQSRHNTQTVLL